MSSGLHVDFAQTQNEGSASEKRRVEALCTLEPGVDSARSQGGPFIRGKEPRVPHSEETSGQEFREIGQLKRSDVECMNKTGGALEEVRGVVEEVRGVVEEVERYTRLDVLGMFRRARSEVKSVNPKRDQSTQRR
jgi:hypothetical protein